MKVVRKIAKVISRVWIITVVLMGVGGAWFSHNRAAVTEGTMGLAGSDFEAKESRDKRIAERREALREAKQFDDAGWGDETAPYQRDDDGWAQP